jgi:hypothetical protein
MPLSFTGILPQFSDSVHALLLRLFLFPKRVFSLFHQSPVFLQSIFHSLPGMGPARGKSFDILIFHPHFQPAHDPAAQKADKCVPLYCLAGIHLSAYFDVEIIFFL